MAGHLRQGGREGREIVGGEGDGVGGLLQQEELQVVRQQGPQVRVVAKVHHV